MLFLSGLSLFAVFEIVPGDVVELTYGLTRQQRERLPLTEAFQHASSFMPYRHYHGGRVRVWHIFLIESKLARGHHGNIRYAFRVLDSPARGAARLATFCIRLQAFPSGWGDPRFPFRYDRVAFVFAYIHHIFILVLANLIIGVGASLRMTRTPMLDQIGQPYIVSLHPRAFTLSMRSATRLTLSCPGQTRRSPAFSQARSCLRRSSLIGSSLQAASPLLSMFPSS